ncbi:MAG: phosphatase PAP2 family protein, partial [Propionibacteriaceae bacterium]|nr:phosphatase PAP2 family protein [Propionibacteriaceae bacterium]
KYIIQRPRPEVLPHLVPGLYPETDPSFPSGHVAIVASMVLVLFLATRQLKLRWVIAGIGAALVATMMCVRMYVGAHFLDDVVASVVYVSTVGTMLYLGLHWLATRWRTVEKIDSWAARHWGFFA